TTQARRQGRFGEAWPASGSKHRECHQSLGGLGTGAPVGGLLRAAAHRGRDVRNPQTSGATPTLRRTQAWSTAGGLGGRGGQLATASSKTGQALELAINPAMGHS